MKKNVATFCLLLSLVYTVTADAATNAMPVVLTEKPESTEGLPNIVLVMADDQGWGDMAYQGHPILKTPTFDAMAKEGLRLDRFYAAAPVCSPTRGSVMTGRHPNRFGCYKWGFPLRPQEVTIAEVLQKVGYKTGHFGKWHLGSTKKGSSVNPGNSGFDVWCSSVNSFNFDPWFICNGERQQIKGEGSEVTVDLANEFIEECVEQKQPFFAVIWFGSPHLTHVTTEKLRKMYEGMGAASRPQNTNVYPIKEWKVAEFLGEITAMDTAVGKLREKIKTLGIKENTLLWYTSDNGGLPCGSTGGRRGYKGSIYEGGLAVPAIVEWPRVITKPRVSLARCNTSDIYPTLLDIVGAKVKNQPMLDGISLKGLFEDKPGSEKRAGGMGFWSSSRVGILNPDDVWGPNPKPAWRRSDNDPPLPKNAADILGNITINSVGGHAAYIEGDWKLHKKIHKVSGACHYELYNLAEDGAEKKNVLEENTVIAEQLKKKINQWQKSVVESLNGKDYATE